MHLRFNEDAKPVFSFTKTETKKLDRVIEELGKIKYYPWIYENNSYELLDDPITLKILNILFRSRIENNIIEIEEYENNDIEYDCDIRKIFQNYLYILYEYSSKYADKMSECIKEEVSKYEFKMNTRFQIITVLRKKGLLAQFNKMNTGNIFTDGVWVLINNLVDRYDGSMVQVL